MNKIALSLVAAFALISMSPAFADETAGTDPAAGTTTTKTEKKSVKKTKVKKDADAPAAGDAKTTKTESKTTTEKAAK